MADSQLGGKIKTVDHQCPEDKELEKLRLMTTLLHERSKGSKAYLWGTMFGIGVGATFLVAGCVILILGLSGSIEWVFEAHGLKSKLTNASPGAFFALLGMIVLWRYKPRVSDRLEMGGLHDQTIQVKHDQTQFLPSSHIVHDQVQAVRRRNVSHERQE